MKLSSTIACLTISALLSLAGKPLCAGPLTQTHQWIQMLEDKQKIQDSAIGRLNQNVASLHKQLDSLSLTIITIPEKQEKLTPEKENNFSGLLLALFAGLAGLLAIAVSVFIPFYFFRENNRLREEVRNLMLELQRIKTAPVSSENREIRATEPGHKSETFTQQPASVSGEAGIDQNKAFTTDFQTIKDKELSTVEFITRLELCIIANQEDEFNHVVAEMVQTTASKETTALLRFLHRVAACVFRGRMPAQAPVMAEVRQFLWACETPVYYQTEKIVSWARSSTRLSDAQRAYIFSISSELDKMLAEHNRQYNH